MKNLWIVTISMIALVGCSSARDTIGLTKKAPDEFVVLKRAPLEMPPDYNLRPPRPGTQRPQEQEPSTQARQTVFGNTQRIQQLEPKTAEEALLRAAKTENADPDIRDRIDGETNLLGTRNKAVVDRLFNRSDEPSATVVDATEEAERIRETLESGETLTGEGSPSIEQ